MGKLKTKESVIELLNKLPEDSNYEDIIAEIYFKKKVEEGIQQLDNGEFLSHEEVKKRMEKWLK
jgi:predicted transcriptional regulator